MEGIRKLVQETQVTANDLIAPLFVSESTNDKSAISSMPGIFRHSQESLFLEVETLLNLGLTTICLFPHLNDSKKDAYATESINHKGIYLSTIKELKKRFPELVIMTDVAMDPYSSDGHDGLVKEGKVINDDSLPILSRMALAQAEAGADILGPSDMMDGRVGYIRTELDNNGFHEVSIMSYSVKYASAFYGPFRDALESAPRFGDKKTYQMNPANKKEALLEAQLDVEEGADFLMVKPAMAYLDIIHLLKEHFVLPIAAYQVSGEYAMIKAAAQNGWLDHDKAMIESLISIKRAGSDIILSYFAKEFLEKTRN